MIELVQLERRHEDFAKRNTRIIAVSIEDVDDAQKTQAENPHLTVLADHSRGLSDVVGLIHKGAARDGGDTTMPTTILIDKKGIVRWLFRPGEIIKRLSPDEVLKAVDERMGK